VLIVGGFLTEPLVYRRVRRRLLERGAGGVSIAPIHVHDWLAAGLVGMGPLMARTGRAIGAARHAGDGRPIIVVAHSGGGILVRLAMCETPFRGRRMAVAEDVGCLVTLGTPHGLATAPVRWRHAGIEAAAFLDASAPGAASAPGTAYLTVGSDVVHPGGPPPNLWDRSRGWAFRAIVGPPLAGGGDGIVSAALSHLEGARQLTLSDVRHGYLGAPWYGDAEVIDRWWPLAVELWRGALDARVADASAPDAVVAVGGGRRPASSLDATSRRADPAGPPAGRRLVG
jgi:hypothetical protein